MTPAAHRGWCELRYCKPLGSVCIRRCIVQRISRPADL